jgi:hypothetical protein
MKKLWKSFKVLIFLLIYPLNSHSLEMNEYGLNHNSFSELQELRTVYITGEENNIIDPEDTESLAKIKDFYLNINFLSDEENTIYQFCCRSEDDDIHVIFVGKINGAEEKFKTLSPREVFDLDKKIKIKNFLVFNEGKLAKSVYIKDDKYNLVEIDPEKQTYKLLFNSQLQFKNTTASIGDVNWGDIPLEDFELEVEFTPNYTSFSNIASRVSVLKIPKLNFFIILDEKSNKIIYTDEKLKKIKYHGEYGENDDVNNPSSFLNPTLLNFLPTEFKKILDAGREINSNYSLNFTLNELIDLISNVEKLNADNVNLAKQKESELQSLIQKKQAEIKAEEAKANAEKLNAAQLEEQKAQEERQKILDQQAEEENQRLLAEYAAADAAEKRQKYMQYGLIILLIGGLIAFIFFTNFLDNLQKFLKQIFSKFKKKKLKSYLPKDYGKKKKKNKKILGNWVADWANSYEDPRSAYYIALTTNIVSVMLMFIFVNIANANPDSTGVVVFGWIVIITFLISGYLAFKIHSGISTYHCPKCKRIYAGEIYKQIHLGSTQQAAKFRVTEKRRMKYRDHQGFTKYNDYEVEKDEYGTEQIDTYKNKTKCLLCNHKWEYDSESSTRVA